MASSTPLDRSNLFSCEGLIVVITGGGTGIRLSMTRALAQNGATVYILGRRLETLTAAAESVNSTVNSPSNSASKSSDVDAEQPNGNPGLTMGKVIPIQADVTSPASLAAAATTIASSSGHINLLIANAGILGPTNRALLPASPSTMSIEEVQAHLSFIPIESFAETYTVNVAGALYTSIAFLCLLDQGNKKGKGRQTSQILVTSSIGGFHRGWTQGGLAYNTSKAAVTHLVKSLAGFLIGWGIRVNGLAPGLFPSEMMASVFGTQDLAVEGALPKTVQPLGRAGREEEMGGTVLYFASEAGAYCSGTIHLVDGGRLGLQPGATY